MGKRKCYEDTGVVDLSAQHRQQFASYYAELRRMAWVFCLGLAIALSIEFFGRILFLFFNVPVYFFFFFSAVALVIFGSVATYILFRLRSSTLVRTLICCGVAVIIVSQVYDVLLSWNLFPLLGFVQENRVTQFILSILFATGFTAVFASFYISIFETHRAKIEAEYRHYLLQAEQEERKKIAAQLYASQQALRTLIEANPESLLLLDTDYNIVVSNSSAHERLAGGDPALENKSLLSFFTAEQTALVHNCFEKAKNEGSICRFEMERFGKIYDCCLCPIQDETGRIQQYAFVEIDITARKEIERTQQSLTEYLEQQILTRTEDLRQVTKRLEDALTLNKELITVSPVGIVAFNDEGFCVVANAAAEEALNLSLEAFFETNFMDTINLIYPQLGEALDIALKTETRSKGELHIRCEDCGPVYNEYFLSPFQSEDKAHVLLILKDVTEQRLAKAQLEKERQLFENAKRLSELDILTSSIAHEIKSPLSIILMGTQSIQHLMEEYPPDREMMNHSLKIIDRNAYRSLDILQSLSSVCRMDNHAPHYEASAAKLVHDAVSMCPYRLYENDIVLHLSCDDSLSCYCQPTQITQVLLNLLNNAHEAVAELEEKWIRLEVVRSLTTILRQFL
ncbi:MAG: PAS domain-containing protein [Candidatus Hydrogenedentes bacterium]|jgi:nitrogen-specific signal transduction histidine kinase|nr:PAS domain-containing protein [Candidatus Hydrogenedentota bacterium]